MSNDIIISPSILSADFSILRDEIHKINNSGVKRIHLDVMDGSYVPNITFGADVIRSLRIHSDLIFETHLMINLNENHISSFIECGSDIIVIHPDSTPNDQWIDLLKLIKNRGKKAGIAIRPTMDLSCIAQCIDYIDQILIMTVNPGYAGQKFVDSQLALIKLANKISSKANHNIEIAVDGGISTETIAKCYDYGARVFVAGTSVFCTPDYSQNVKNLLQAITII